jgi:hypothetical protein
MNRKTADREVQRRDEGSSNIILSARTDQDTDAVAVNVSMNTDQILLHETGEGSEGYRSLCSTISLQRVTQPFCQSHYI